MLKQRTSSAEGVFKPHFSLATRWALNTCEALAYLHGLSHPIIHRDLKPLNMFLSRSLEVASAVWNCLDDLDDSCMQSTFDSMFGQVHAFGGGVLSRLEWKHQNMLKYMHTHV